NLGPNPKVNNMFSSYQLAKNDLVLISDSNVRVDSDYLKKLSSYVRDPNVGMVTAVISGIEAQGLGGRLEAVFLNTFYSRWMRLLFFVGRPCVVGKSMLFRKSTARRFGGMNVLARYLAEDFMAGEAIRRLGMKIALANEPVSQWIGSLKLRDFWSRHIRWGRIRKSQAFLAFMVEPILGSVVCSLMGSLAFYGFAQINPINFFMGQMILWFLLEIPLIVKSRTSVSFSVAVFWFIRELLAFPLWLHIAMGNSVHWRGRKLKLAGGGLLESEESNEITKGINIHTAF
ncbi:MAG: glycosyltransferase family 21 protein, partial [Deltaproteobacteria bacterium]